MSVSEQAFQTAILMGLSAAGYLAYRQNCGEVQVRDRSGKVQSTFRAGPPRGASDIVAIAPFNGRYVAIEVKSAKGKQTPEQRAWQVAVELRLGTYVLARYAENQDMTMNVLRVVRDVTADARR